MSGICGIVLLEKNAQLSSDSLLPMVRALDISAQGNGLTANLGSVVIGTQPFSRRLAGLAQMTLRGQPLALAFHGSLYNLPELFSAAERRADPFPAAGLMQLYVKEGMAFLHRLRGEFAIAVWDGWEETLYLATDRFRVHPLFYCHTPEKLVFASRLKGILACPLQLKWTVNPEAIVDMVASSVIPTPKTIFREVQKLPPGHLLTYRKGKIQLSPYWDITFLQPSNASEDEIVRALKRHFTDAVGIRLGEDGSDRIGSFLSGGIDSSTVTGVLTHLIQRPLKSFSIGFDEQRYNEIRYARIAARAFGAEHYEYFVTPQDVYDAMPLLGETFDEPFANASAIPTYFCAKIAQEQGVEILYAGDGGDELFAGNERYATQRLFDYYREIPVWFREPVIKPMVFALADAFGWELLCKGKKYIQRASIPYPERLSSYGVFQVVDMDTMLTADLLETVGGDYNTQACMSVYYFQAPAQSNLDRQLYIDLKLAISDNDLFKVTRMAEAAGVTVRFPFLDHHLAEFAATIPARMKMRGRQLRSLFKRAYADLLPSEIRAKQKHGFGLPIPLWLRTDKRLNEMMYDLVLSSRSLQRGYFRKRGLEKLVEFHKTDETAFYGTLLWNLMILELWLRRYADVGAKERLQNTSSPLDADL